MHVCIHFLENIRNKNWKNSEKHSRISIESILIDLIIAKKYITAIFII